MTRAASSRRKFACPCCGSRVLHARNVYEICPVCGWEDDPVQGDDPGYAGGANALSLNEARKRWTERKTRLPD